MQVRQGDVFLESCAAPDINEAQFVKAEGGRLVLAHGESTGHAHAVRAEHAVMMTVAAIIYLRVLEHTKLLHEEHPSIDVEPGFYRVIRQMEHTPAEARRVED